MRRATTGPRTSTAAASDALLDHAAAWTFESVASISRDVLDEASADRDLRDDPSLRPDAMTPQMHALLGDIARNRGTRGLATAEGGGIKMPPRRYEEDEQESAERERRTTAAMDTFLSAGTRNERRRAREEFSAAQGPAAGAANDESESDSGDESGDGSDADDIGTDALHTFATVGLRAHEAASGHDVRVPWRDAPPPVLGPVPGQGQAPGHAGPGTSNDALYALLDAPTRRLIERAPPGSALDELSAHLASYDDESPAETAVQFCSALARCGCAYVKRGYAHEHASHYYVHAISAHAPLFLVSYVSVCAPASTTTTTVLATLVQGPVQPVSTTTVLATLVQGPVQPVSTTTSASETPLIDDQSLVRWRSGFFFCAPPQAAPPAAVLAPGPVSAAAKRGRHQ